MDVILDFRKRFWNIFTKIVKEVTEFKFNVRSTYKVSLAESSSVKYSSQSPMNSTKKVPINPQKKYFFKDKTNLSWSV